MTKIAKITQPLKINQATVNRWTLVDSTVHEFSNGVATVYCYRHTGERHMIEVKPLYDEGFTAVKAVKRITAAMRTVTGRGLPGFFA